MPLVSAWQMHSPCHQGLPCPKPCLCWAGCPAVEEAARESSACSRPQWELLPSPAPCKNAAGCPARPALPPAWAFLLQDPGPRVCPPTTLPSSVCSTLHARLGHCCWATGSCGDRVWHFPGAATSPGSCTAMNFAGVLAACRGAPSLVLSMGNSAPRPEPAAPRGRAGAGHGHVTPRLQVGAPPHPWALPAQTGPEPQCPHTSPSPATPPCPPAPVTAVPAARATWGCVAGVRRGLCWPTSAQMFLAVKGGPERGRLCCCCPGPDDAQALCPWRSPELLGLTGTAPSVNEAQADG